MIPVPARSMKTSLPIGLAWFATAPISFVVSAVPAA